MIRVLDNLSDYFVDNISVIVMVSMFNLMVSILSVAFIYHIIHERSHLLRVFRGEKRFARVDEDSWVIGVRLVVYIDIQGSICRAQAYPKCGDGQNFAIIGCTYNSP